MYGIEDKVLLSKFECALLTVHDLCIMMLQYI